MKNFAKRVSALVLALVGGAAAPGSYTHLDQARQWGHSTFGQSATLAAQARAKRLWLTHYSPMITDPEEYAAQAQSIFPARSEEHTSELQSQR